MTRRQNVHLIICCTNNVLEKIHVCCISPRRTLVHICKTREACTPPTMITVVLWQERDPRFWNNVPIWKLPVLLLTILVSFCQQVGLGSMGNDGHDRSYHWHCRLSATQPDSPHRRSEVGASQRLFPCKCTFLPPSSNQLRFQTSGHNIRNKRLLPKRSEALFGIQGNIRNKSLTFQQHK